MLFGEQSKLPSLGRGSGELFALGLAASGKQIVLTVPKIAAKHLYTVYGCLINRLTMH